MIGDLHCHSRHSDGSCTVRELISYASRIHLDYLAVTDHDTYQGVAEALDLGGKYHVGIIPGLECTTRDPGTGRPVHVLCYRPKRFEVLDQVTELTSGRRTQSKLQMLEKLKAYYPICTEDVAAYAADSSAIFEPHIMQGIANLGYTNAIYGPLMDELIGKKGKCYVPIEYPDIYDVIDIMHDAGGLVVIAHPGQFRSIPLVRQLAASRRIEGIECYHYRNTEEDTRELLKIARANDLIITGGTDFHGMNSRQPYPLGTYTTDDENLRRILAFS
ncbi:PHP domain-containing protein [Diplocloster hominis]|uniref:PHP domain-containing protein n=1 Tax=Diplocloster hominis TaxID=3079010 RepID=UPI0031BADF91